MVNKLSLFPPSYSVDQFTWSSPFVIGPSILLGVFSSNGSSIINRRLTAFSKFLVFLCFVVVFTLIADATVIVTRAILEQYWTSSVLAFYIGISWLAWALSLFALADETQQFGKWYWTQYLFWILAVVSDTLVGWLWTMAILKPEPNTELTIYDHFLLGIFVIRYIVEVIIVLLSIAHLFSTNHNTIQEASETSPLLTSTQNRQYGVVEVEAIDTSEKELSPFNGFVEKMRKLLPFIWPHRNLKLQLYVVLCFVIMILGFAVNLLAPRQIEGQFPWIPVLFYIGLKFLQGGSGLLQAIQNWLWIPIGQFTTREISLKTFSHLHSLSLGFHISRKTGEVLRVMDRGTSSVVSLLNQILFQIFPVWANIILISFFTTYMYAPSFGLIVFLTMIMYMYVTVAVTEWRTKYRRRMIELDNYARTKAVDSLLNFETVKYYNAESFEINRYKDAILEYQEADWKSSVSLNVLNLAQNAIITGGLLSGCLLFAYEVSSGELSAVTLVRYLLSNDPSNFIDMEKMLELLDEVQTVQDAPDAGELMVSQGHVVFDNVTFSYDGRQTALDGVSFTIPKGATVALVGPSGGGKSTILRLLFRFYDPNAGRIYIDGQDISQVTQLSLRKNIGVVPQDTVLFNDTIYYNIQY
ncbi:ABC transporter type 1, transmembrane domain-containing protein, partial [Choanephora cucurbitarum]